MTGQERAMLVDRLLLLTRHVLPGMAVEHAWPVRLDHCFMRICLDEAVGAPWDRTVRRPAIRHATAAQLRRAVHVAERVVRDPASLAGLNAASLSARRRVRS